MVTLLSPLLICLGDQLQRQRSQGLGQWASVPAYPGRTCGDARGARLTALPAQGLLLPERKGLSPLLTLQSPLEKGQEAEQQLGRQQGEGGAMMRYLCNYYYYY